MSSGKSLALKQKKLPQPPKTKDGAQNQSDEPSPGRQKRRQASVYDAVAGRINAHGFIPSVSYASKHRDTASSTARPVPPEEVLFRRKNAPIRYQENDFYFAHESLPADRPLPDSDLLDAIHAYSADFYDREPSEDPRDDHRSMDETALIAMGILIEEMARESLGKTKDDLVRVKGLKTAHASQPASLPSGQSGRKRANTGRTEVVSGSGDEMENTGRERKRSKRSKKRRLSTARVTDMDTGADAQP